MSDTTLPAVLDDLGRRSRLAVVRFTDGEVYELRFISTGHVEQGGDMVAEVIRVDSSTAIGGFPVGTFINFHLADVESITLEAIRVFGRET